MDLKNLRFLKIRTTLIAAVAAVNPHTIVVLETGTVVTMPWANNVSGIMEAWYGGSKGADAIANVLFGDVNPSGKLPITFPKTEVDLPHPTMLTPPPGAQRRGSQPSTERDSIAKPTFKRWTTPRA